MSLYTEWRNLSDNHENQEAEVKFWEAYLQAEASIYNERKFKGRYNFRNYRS